MIKHGELIIISDKYDKVRDKINNFIFNIIFYGFIIFLIITAPIDIIINKIIGGQNANVRKRKNN